MKNIPEELEEKTYTESEVQDLIEDWTKMTSGLNINFHREKFDKWFQKMKK